MAKILSRSRRKGADLATKVQKNRWVGMLKRNKPLAAAGLVLLLLVGAFVYNNNTNKFAGDFEDDSELMAAMNCLVIDNEVVGEALESVADCPSDTVIASDAVESTCSFELPSDVSANCPEQAILGDTTSTLPMAWPIKKESWPGLKTRVRWDGQTEAYSPIANCDLKYSVQQNKTVSSGIEIAVPKGTPVYAAADGVVHYVQPGSGVLIIKTNLKNAAGKQIFTSYLLLSERYVTTGQVVKKNDLIAKSGSGAPAAELAESLHFGVWTTGDFIGGHPTIDSAAGKALLSKMEHPMNYLPLDGRVVSSCKDIRPYSLPTPSGAPTPTPTPPPGNKMQWPVARANWPNRTMPIAECGLRYRDGTVHTGIDISVPYGTPLYAAADGAVTYTGPGAYIIRTNMKNKAGKTLYLNYQHMSVVSYRKGSLVKKGQLIGRSGRTNTTSPHLHFGVWTTSAYINGHMSSTSSLGRARYAVMEHPMNYLPHDGRRIYECKGEPYRVPDLR